MTSSSDSLGHTRAYAWTWLPGSVEPVVAGIVEQRGDRLHFGYGESYLDLPEAISLYGPELPLSPGWIEPLPGLTLAGVLRDATPDTWGRRVIESRLGVDENSLTEIEYMLASGSNRLGAIDFQTSSSEYAPRIDMTSLDELHAAADALQEGKPLSQSLAEALVHGTTIGGARPKVLIRDGDGVDWIAKLSASSDKVFSVINAEATSLELARRVGMRVPETDLVVSLGRDVLLVRRFDRTPGGQRHHVVSALTMAQEDENGARYVSYPTIVDRLREHASEPSGIGRELFERIVFNIAIGNSDDHARNHAAFWDGDGLALTPAYDLAPGPRSGETASQAMAIGRDGRKDSTFVTCLDSAAIYGLSRSEARDVIDNVVSTISDNWTEAADIGRMSEAERERLFGRQFLNPYASYGYTSIRP